jgi:xanthine/CO dehydrogenase XdhC/CoxF family maturation factor
MNPSCHVSARNLNSLLDWNALAAHAHCCGGRFPLNLRPASLKPRASILPLALEARCFLRNARRELIFLGAHPAIGHHLELTESLIDRITEAPVGRNIYLKRKSVSCARKLRVAQINKPNELDNHICWSQRSLVLRP